MATSTISIGVGGISEPFTHGQVPCSSSSLLHPGWFGNSKFPNLSDGGCFFYKTALVSPVGPGTPSSCCLASSRPVKDWGRKKRNTHLQRRKPGETPGAGRGRWCCQPWARPLLASSRSGSRSPRRRTALWDAPAVGTHRKERTTSASPLPV